MYKVVVTDGHGSFESSPMESLAVAKWMVLRMEQSDSSVSAKVVECDPATMNDIDCKFEATPAPVN